MLRRFDVAHELTLPWLLAALAAAHWRVYPLALLASFMFFLTGLRQVHNAYHYALGLPRAATEWVMFAMSVLMLGSMHAVQVNHLSCRSWRVDSSFAHDYTDLQPLSTV